MEIRDFQKLIRDTFHERDAARGITGNFLWFTEEVGELAKAIRDPKKSRENLEEEFADVLAWLMSLATIKEVDLEVAALNKYGKGCPRCKSIPCSCPPSADV